MRDPSRPVGVLLVGLLLVLGGAVALPGCRSASKLQGRAVLNADRELEANLNADLLGVHEAARRVLVEAYQYRIFVDRRKARGGLIRARTEDERLVRVETYYEGTRRTRIQVFVSPMGDEEKQRAILAEIERAL
ncbi:MAG: DUF3568 family protein [Planctomycetota bacterium]|nr:DUF3568 family protein [Planctomycetota bacterium]